MYELIQAAEHTWYIQSPARMGLVKCGETEVALIDSGSDRDAGRKALKHIEAQGWRLCAIYNTHSHADHIGGNHYLQSQTRCPIYAPGVESAFVCHPLLEPSLLYAGCPPRALRHKFLMAQESLAAPLTKASLPEGLTAIPLPGHAMDMVGFRTADDVVFLADCLSSKETLNKYRIGYTYDVGAELATLEAVKTMRARLFIPAHAEVTEDIAPLAQYNIDKINETAERICALCAQPRTPETLMKNLFDGYGLTFTMEQYALVGSTVRSYLTWLGENGRLEARIENNLLLWAAV